MKKLAVLAMVTLLALAGCCGTPQAMQDINTVMNTLQQGYPAIVGAANAIAGKPVLPGTNNAAVQQTTVAVDTSLALGGTLQQQWCATAAQAAQLKTSAASATAQANQAGIAVPVVPLAVAPAAATTGS